MTIGFVGMGVMGAPMAGHLLESGADLWIWNRTPGKTDDLAKRGAHVAESLEALGAQCDVVFLCVGKSEDVVECVTGLFSTLKRGSSIVDHSTISPQTAMDMRMRAASRGIEFIDAPVTGGSVGAQKGQLTIFCGGDEETIEMLKPVMMAYAKRVERVGSSGAGQTAKMANQIAVAGSLLALCESLSFAKKAGLDLAQIKELVGGGAGGSWAFDNYGPKILERDWTPGFSIANQRKDLGYCKETAIALDAAIPGTVLVDHLLKFLDDEGHGDWTTAALYEQLLCMGFDA